MEHTKRAEERREKLAKKLAPEAIEWIEQRAVELARADLLSSVIRTKHMNEAYEQWKHEQEISPEEALAHEQEDGVWLGKMAYCATMRPNGHVVLTDEQSKIQFIFTAQEAYDLFHFLRRYKDELQQKAK
jgi:hypothetical protein